MGVGDATPGAGMRQPGHAPGLPGVLASGAPVPQNQAVMAAPTSPAGRRPRLGDRLAGARRRRFVGRAAELALFASALAAPEPPFALLYVHGPGGVGKTVLLGEFARLAADTAVPAVRLDGRDLDPSPPGFLAALGRALGEAPDTSPLEALALRPRGVLLVDTYETLAPLDAWLRETLLPELPAGHLVVLAGRDPPAAGWLADAGWRDLARVVPLRNLRPSESRAYLSARASRPPSTRPPCRSPAATPWPCRWWPTSRPRAATRPPLPPSGGRTWSGPCWSGSCRACPAPATARRWRPAPTSG
jgi:hypothetical protein